MSRIKSITVGRPPPEPRFGRYAHLEKIVDAAPSGEWIEVVPSRRGGSANIQVWLLNRFKSAITTETHDGVLYIHKL